MHRAGNLLKAWRAKQSPPLSVEQFAALYGFKTQTVFGWESKGRIARPQAQRKLAELGICEAADWITHVDSRLTADDTIAGDSNRFYDLHTHGFVRVATSTPQVRTADVSYNAQGILEEARRAHTTKVDLLLYPELCLSSYALDDLHIQAALLDAVEQHLLRIVEASRDLVPVLVLGAPLRRGGRIYNCALVIARGAILGVVPKSYLPNYREFYEKRWFARGNNCTGLTINIGDDLVPFGTDLIFAAENLPGFIFGIEICEDFWAPNPPGVAAALAGATILLNLSASNITIGKSDERHMLTSASSARCVCAYAYSASGYGESTTDLAWDGQGMIYELGDLMAESARFDHRPELCVVDVDTRRILNERMRMGTFNDAAEDAGRPEDYFRRIGFDHCYQVGDIGLERPIRRFPFVPNRPDKLDADCYEAFNIQVDGLMRRIEATHAKTLVIGISGGLDSTHALIVAAKALDRLGRPRSDIRGYTMPGFATSEKTRTNAWRLMEAFGITAEEIDIRPAAERMLEDIGHPYSRDEKFYDTTFENVQAGLRTDYLFRLAGQHSGFVIGTGDLSELALGWCTYGVGDQMSHYAVNSGVPKTLIQYLIRWTVRTDQFDTASHAVLGDIVDTEISPELVPADADGAIQSTQAIIGPYELNDFFLNHVIRWGQSPGHVAFLAWHAWRDAKSGLWPIDFPDSAKNEYDLATIAHWLENFLKRFFGFSQFKRSALPNGPKVSAGGALSPRGDWRAPSDAVADVWLADLAAALPPLDK
ncbi:MAG: NAD(+) synthase [Sphingomonadaceae bacterium]